MTDMQEAMWYALCDLPGEEVLRLLTDWHGLQLLDEGFREHLADEGVMDSIYSDDEIEDDDEQIDEDNDDCGNEAELHMCYLIYKDTIGGKEYVTENDEPLIFTGILDAVKYFSSREQSFADMLRTGYRFEGVVK